jgi:uncharacterized protein YdiU (UPF0061 family)
MPFGPTYQPAPSFTALGRDFYDPVPAAEFPSHQLRYRNDRAAATVGLDGLDAEEWARHFAALEGLPRNLEERLALRYHGHQFRMYNSALGDGRGFLHAQLLDTKGRLLDLGTKGSGTTPWSRGGDGKLTLQGAVREVLATEMLEALGVYTSKTFSVYETGEQLIRYDEPSPTRSAVLVRLSHSHVRFGSFQRHLFHRKPEHIRALLDFSLDNYLPALSDISSEQRPAAFLEEVMLRSARLAATWLLAGFVHGVLNTDNMNITGESFDYGPWRFLPTYDPGFTAAYFDHSGLYAFGRQAEAVQWNLGRLAECLLPLSNEEALVPILEGFEAAFAGAMSEQFTARMGLVSQGGVADGALIAAALTFLGRVELPYERLFFDWWGGEGSAERAAASPEASVYESPKFKEFRQLMADYEPRVGEGASHPYFGGSEPCTLLIDEVEAIWAAISSEDDWSVLEAKLAQIRGMGEALALVARPR